MIGRRLPDTPMGSLPEGMQPGDVWRLLLRDADATAAVAANWPGADPEMVKGNLTGGVWMYYSPDGNGLGTLVYHTVREHEDGTISVLPGDGSSNSILHSGAQDKTWHGYIRHGVWEPV